MAGISNSQNIKNFYNVYPEIESVSPILEWVEKKFECTGICFGHYLYVFSDVNKGVVPEY